jgi:hypothetical protein
MPSISASCWRQAWSYSPGAEAKALRHRYRIVSSCAYMKWRSKDVLLVGEQFAQVGNGADVVAGQVLIQARSEESSEASVANASDRPVRILDSGGGERMTAQAALRRALQQVQAPNAKEQLTEKQRDVDKRKPARGQKGRSSRA